MSIALYQHYKSSGNSEGVRGVVMPEVTITMDDDALTELKTEIGIKSINEEVFYK